MSASRRTEMLYGQYDNVEIWKRHPVYYKHSCSTLGRVRRDACLGKDGRRLQARILKQEKNSSGSWQVRLWGYGSRAGHTVGHLVLETFFGPAPSGEEACHGPAGRDCHRLDNLYWGTQQRNARDRERDGTVARGSRQHLAKLTEDDVALILADGRSLQRIAREYGVAKQTIWRIKNRKTWGHASPAA